MAKQFQDLYNKVITAQKTHTNFLNATEKNLSYYLLGRDVPIVKKMTFPHFDLVSTLGSYLPKPYNPLNFLVNSFIDELANSEFTINVNPSPVRGKEPYQSFANELENYLEDIHYRKRRKMIRGMIFELLAHGFFGIYSNGEDYWFLSAYDIIPGDELVDDFEDQPFLVRRTYPRKAQILKMAKKSPKKFNKDALSAIKKLSPLDPITVYDSWVKELDLNVCFLIGGKVLYKQKFPKPKRYPIVGATDGAFTNCFYTKPLMQSLRVLLPKYQDALENLEESSKSIANPILTYDADAGIDVNALQTALKEGYKRIIVGKNREGSIGFEQPGRLPSYSRDMPDILGDQMMKHLGLTPTFLGRPTGGTREKGAIGRLLKTTFRKLGTYAGLIEKTFSELDNYLIDWGQTHQMKLSQKKTGIKNPEELFRGKVRYRAEERLKGFSSEDTLANKKLSLRKWKDDLISQEETLRELGHHQPKEMIEERRKEMEANQKFAKGMKEELQEKTESLWDKIFTRLKGKLKHKFWISPFSRNKMLVKCAPGDKKQAAFLLSDLKDQVMIGTMEKKSPTKEQATLGVEESKKKTPTRIETRGRPPEEETGPGQIKRVLKQLEKRKEEPPKKEESPEQEKASSPKFSEKRMKNLIARSHTIKNPKKFLQLPGFYLVEPHAKWIHNGKKLLILKSREFKKTIDTPHLLAGDKVYGVIMIRDILKDFDFENTQKYHQVSNKERKKWWRDKKLYLYLFEYHPFREPLEWEVPSGVQTFLKAGNVKVSAEDIGSPQKGDLKPVKLKPWKIPPVHKPEKKAFQAHEVFKLSRLKEMIPKGTYDISSKIDGLRCFTWIKDGEVRMYSDQGNKFTDRRVKPLLEKLPKIFKHDVLLDGELTMEGVRRKDIAGYIHGEWKPKPEELKTLRFTVWDILYVKNKSIASKDFSTRSSVLDLYLKNGCEGPICRVDHSTAKRDKITKAVKKVTTTEGAMIRDVGASYWATHSTYKMKYQYDVDVKVIAVEKTKTGLPVFHTVLRDGTYIGQTYAQSEVKAKPGDVIRVNIDHVTIRPNGSIGWFAPSPKSYKEGKITPKKVSTTQVDIGGPDSMSLMKEIYLASGGTKKRWKDWLPKFKKWKKEEMPKLIKKVKKKYD